MANDTRNKTRRGASQQLESRRARRACRTLGRNKKNYLYRSRLALRRETEYSCAPHYLEDLLVHRATLPQSYLRLRLRLAYCKENAIRRPQSDTHLQRRRPAHDVRLG